MLIHAIRDYMYNPAVYHIIQRYFKRVQNFFIFNKVRPINIVNLSEIFLLSSSEIVNAVGFDPSQMILHYTSKLHLQMHREKS